MPSPRRTHIPNAWPRGMRSEVIEVKRYHSPRITEQMSRTENVVAIQGWEAARVFAELISVPIAQQDRA